MYDILISKKYKIRWEFGGYLVDEIGILRLWHRWDGNLEVFNRIRHNFKGNFIESDGNLEVI